MNDDILIAKQGNCDVALVDSSKILHYKNKSGNDQSLDIADLVNLTDGTGLFDGNKNLNIDWEISLPNLTNGDDMFQGCTSLTSFSGDIPSLTNGDNMFYNCILDETSALNILNSIPTHTDGETHSLHLGKRTNYQTSGTVAAKLRTSTGRTVSTPIPAATNYRCVDDDGNDKGWTITVTN